MIENKPNTFNIDRVALLYRDLLSNNMHALPNADKSTLLSIQSKNKIVAIGDVDTSNWNAYPLTWLLANKITNPTVLDESKIYQSIQAMRTCNHSIAHPQTLISDSVVIRMIGYESSPNVNDYLNTFIGMCIASDVCKVVFIVIDGDKKFYKNNIYIKKSNSSFIDYTDKSTVKIESAPLVVNPDEITFFNYSKECKPTQAKSKTLSSTNKKKTSCSSILNDLEFI